MLKIGDDEKYLWIEPADLGGGVSAWRMQAYEKCSHGEIFARNDAVVSNSSDDLRREFTEFESLRRQAFEMLLSAGGWLRLERMSRGNIQVRYRIASWRGDAAVEGKLTVEGEYGNDFCANFRKVSFG